MFDRYVGLAKARELTGLSDDTLRRNFDNGTYSGKRSPGGHRKFDVLSLPQPNTANRPTVDTHGYYVAVMGEQGDVPANIDQRRSPVTLLAAWTEVAATFPYWDIPANTSAEDLRSMQINMDEMKDIFDSLSDRINAQIKAVDDALSRAEPNSPPRVIKDFGSYLDQSEA